MPYHASALKSHRASERKRVIRGSAKSALKTCVKGFLNAEKKELAGFSVVQSALMRAGQKGLIHRKKAARLISRLSAKVDK